jgi:uncharacterized protein
MTAILIDTGPLVALLRADDPQRAVCETVTKTLRLPLLSCWPVITEAAYLLRRSPQAVSTLLAYCNGSLVNVLPVEKADLPGIDAILRKYADQKFDLADAVLMHVAEREGVDTIFTLDRRHFSVYRDQKGRGLTLLP